MSSKKQLMLGWSDTGSSLLRTLKLSQNAYLGLLSLDQRGLSARD